jgi:uncharacterized FAD-dependent dehydrogenase
MLRINQLKLRPDHTEKELKEAIYKALRLQPSDTCEYQVFRRSIDARHKPEIYYVYSIDIHNVVSKGQKVSKDQIMHRAHNKNLLEAKEPAYEFPTVSLLKSNCMKEDLRPVIIGFGPAGMFAALKLAEAGARPIIYERGEAVDERHAAVERYWNGESLDLESNVQFGEGGAGTFSDGKLNTMIKDPTGRIRETLKVFVTYGADPSILYVNKPHIGTDVLRQIVKNIREQIISLGGEVFFNTRLDKINVCDDSVQEIELTNTKTGVSFIHSCKLLCLAIGHSARDTFEMMHKSGFPMEAKAFAVGVRIEHPQTFINQYAYGNTKYQLGAADYKLTYQTSLGRGVYSFCMCPGGYVVDASSESGRIAVNGMSYSKRDSANANSAIIVTVTPEDFGTGVLDGVHFQRKMEQLAYEQGKGHVPVQLLSDFRARKVSTGFGGVKPCIRGQYEFGDLNKVLPSYIADSISEGIKGFNRHIPGYDMEDALLAGVESRTSSPVRILRNEQLESRIQGLYPCGEGAGYAGGITSAAVDGIKVAEKVALRMVEMKL